MRECRKIERLIHLHREGERTAQEERRVREHVAGCPGCARLFRSMAATGEAIAAARGHRALVNAPADLVGGAMAALAGAGAGGADRRKGMRRALSPAFAFAVLCGLVLLAQQGRDAVEAAGMERRLRQVGAAAREGTVAERLSALSAVFDLRAGGGRGTAVAGASAVPWFLVPGVERGDLFREYAGRYPALARVNPYDGIDDAERRALATEGRAFLEEVRTLIRKGESTR